MSILVPAVLPKSRADLVEKLALFAKMPNISRVQIDVVDGTFASPASWPYTAPEEFRAMVARGTHLPLLDRFEYEIDLMCLDSERAADDWLALGASRLTFHAETTSDFPRLLAHMHERHTGGPGFCLDLVAFGACIGAGTSTSVLEPALAYADYVQFMGIARIGKQGQPFDPRVLSRVQAFHARYPQVPVQVDGGETVQHARDLAALGASNVIVGSAILRAKDPLAAAQAFDDIRTSYGV